MASVERKTEKLKAFYCGYGQKRQTSAEIVTEARHSLRTLRTQRPFTPREEQRQLFGGSARGRSECLQHLLHQKPRLPLSPGEACSGDGKGVPKPPAERTVTRGLGGARSRLARSRSLPVVASETQHTKTDDIKDVEPNLIPPPQQWNAESFNRQSMHEEKSPERSSQKLTHIPNKHRTARPSSADVCVSSDATRGRVDTTESDESIFWTSEVLPVLQMFESVPSGETVSKETVEHLCNACTVLHDILSEKGMLGKRFKKRTQVLRALFRLIDLRSDQLNLTLTKVILALRVSGNNLLNICKLVFKISRNSRNDFLFQDNSLLGSLVSLIRSEDLGSTGEAALYLTGALKLLSGNNSLARLLLAKDFISVSLQLLQRPIQTPDLETFPNNHSTSAERDRHAITGHVLVQVTAALRNLADLSESRPSFLSSGVFPTLCAVMDCYRDDQDVCLNIARIFSKLSSYTECCYALAETVSCYRLFLDLLCKHGVKQALVVRLMFTLGNLAAKSNNARLRVYEEEHSIYILLELFQRYLRVPGFQHEEEDEDVLRKLIRVLANLSIHPAVGTALAANPLCVQLLLKVMEVRSVEESAEVVLNASATISNLSYYQSENSVVRAQHTHVSELLLRILSSSNMEAVLEATRAFGNLSQMEEVQGFMITNKAHRFIVALLDSKNPDVCLSACGVLTNLSTDPENRRAINQEGAVPKLIDCLRDFGPRDWILAAQACQTLWNCTEDGQVECVDELLEILTLYSDQKALQWPYSEHLKAHQEACWELEFLPVAERLKKRMSRYAEVSEAD
ncbi:Armadillo repeat-containing protein 2 [Bagarius yarrelli]|uniref:Armadillo repeat-containing protein 2 n=1 Tax=Bagarius yarrelli TaxID=175774 RepID=A0A556TZL4_BAGYA|nr:Armadillo repeat-containing protein 2 [Bagarius yarrelli]